MLLFLWVRLFNLYDWIKNFFFYYLRFPKFGCTDNALLLSYFFKSPYRIARQLYPQSGPYGETPFSCMKEILSRIPSLKKGARVLEVGCGRGRLAFWFCLVRGFHVQATDINSVFIRKAHVLSQALHIPVSFQERSYFSEKDCAQADLIYLFLLHLPEEELTALGKGIIQSGTKGYIVTISFWFGEVLPHAFELVEVCEVRFVWGKTLAYIQKIA